VDARIEKGNSKDEAILKELQKLITESKDIRFEGNGYGDEWMKEAKRRGLSNLKDTPSALKVWKKKESIQLFEEQGVLTERELLARQEIEFEKYILRVQIEARLIGDMTQNHIIPAVINYQNQLVKNVLGLREVLGKDAAGATRVQEQLIRDLSMHLDKMQSFSREMLDKRKQANKVEDIEKRSEAYRDTVKVYFDEIAYHANKLEILVDDELWPFPKLREMLFTK
jgi:glutamine synthetase